MKHTIKNVVITGGTHGNELTGVYLIHKFLAHPEKVKRESFKTLCMHTNVGAMKQCTRYVDKDLNRTFTLKALNDYTLTAYEDSLSKVINQRIGPKGSKEPAMDLVIDLHTTTSDMGLSICVSTTDAFTWQAIAYVQEQIPELNIFRWNGDTDDASFVSSIPPHGITIEVGPIPQGVLRADMFFGTERVVQTILDYVELYNRGEAKQYTTAEIYDHVELIDYPRNAEGQITAMLHPHLQDNGYAKIEKGDPLFVTLEGEDVCYEGTEPRYILFANEAAYYEKHFSMCLTDQKTITL
jgi:aspartoacylase